MIVHSLYLSLSLACPRNCYGSGCRSHYYCYGHGHCHPVYGNCSCDPGYTGRHCWTSEWEREKRWGIERKCTYTYTCTCLFIQSVVEAITELTVYTSKTIITHYYYYYYHYHFLLNKVIITIIITITITTILITNNNSNRENREEQKGERCGVTGLLL